MADRVTTFLRNYLIRPLTAPGARRRMPQRVIFLHVPRTAGTSLHALFHAVAGPPRHGQSAMLDDSALARPDILRLGRRARYVGGHFGPRVLEAIRGDAVVFTVLRDPLERLVSVWLYAQSLRDPALRLPFATLEEALASDHPRIREAFDNVIARQLGAGYDLSVAGRVPRDEWAGRAHDVLRRMDHVATTPALDSTLPAILADAGLPADIDLNRLNASADRNRANRAPDRALPPLPDTETLARLAAPFLELDRTVCAGHL